MSLLSKAEAKVSKIFDCNRLFANKFLINYHSMHGTDNSIRFCESILSDSLASQDFSFFTNEKFIDFH